MPTSDLVNKGYFPRELPPPFTTFSLANVVASGVLPETFVYNHGNKNYTSKPAVHNLARAGSLRRKLSVPNPANFVQLANTIHSNWTALGPSFYSPYSISTPKLIPASSDRAIAPEYPFSEIQKRRVLVRAGARYGLRTDVNLCYQSIYTHSIPWALHGKLRAKKARRAPTLGNLIDVQVRNGQDNQTVGIPIGPDTSLAIAEAILSCVDGELAGKTKAVGFRYLDDYEFAFQSYTEAERVLSLLQSLLSEYELSLNPKKTFIFELPANIEEPFAGDLRTFTFRSKKSQAGDLLAYFDKAFGHARAHPDGNALNYAISRLRGVSIHPDNWSLYENLLLQCATAEPGCLPYFVTELHKYSAVMSLDIPKIREALGRLVMLHAPLEHGSEVIWALWGCKLFGISVPDSVAKTVGRMRDNFVALVALHLRQLGQISASVEFGAWKKLMKGAELSTENWLLAYEANAKGWLPAISGTDFVTSDPTFGPLKSDGVYFYDTAAVGPGAQLAPESYDLEELGDEEAFDDELVNGMGMSP